MSHRVAKVIKHFRIGAARLPCRHIFGYSRAAPPIFLGVVVENTPALHAEAVPVGLGADGDDFCLNSPFGKKFAPYFSGFGVLRHTVLRIADKRRYVQILRVETDFRREKFKEKRQLLLFEIIAERPVAEHFEKCRVTVVADFFDVFRTKTFLTVHQPVPFGVRFAEEVRDKRLHTASCEKCRRVVLRNNGRRRDYGVPARFKKFQILGAYLVDSHLEESNVFFGKEKGSRTAEPSLSSAIVRSVCANFCVAGGSILIVVTI
ncbi:MAG: hypothetical protein UV20_C0044G0006 [Candidatus Magasanikbacteria bacterium GW2011_GWA2_42_32]|uniref:Uncharacterized protein n=1 Tax=Candidatus Magasanikbacteria bacterium GW2011_GWA2_42_32 TaxID=1619039 RepID=A0A0G0ZZ21_9BACT|nr:MAG: hypothetical protein UV20_C0044G0006 [Candidatus Magasanikbacteria bacterium GW2011_GWA2_42_32]